MPSLANRFQSYRQFANATLSEVYPAEQLDRALVAFARVGRELGVIAG